MARRRRKRKVKFAERCLEEVRADGLTIEAPCPVQSTCGGCTWQEVEYATQLEFKRRFIHDCFERVGLEQPIEPVLPSPETYGYRNHMEFSFSPRRWLTREEIDSGTELDRSFALGLHAPGGFNRVLNVESCALQADDANLVLAVVSEFAKESDKLPYDPVEHTGFWRYLIVRKGVGSGQLLVMVVTRDRDAEMMARLAETLRDRVPSLVCVANGVTERVADTSEGADVHVDAGEESMLERVGDLEFEISPESFFQPNTKAARILFDLVSDMAAVDDRMHVVDLFCGTGTLSLWVARKAGSLHGLELVEPAIVCARENAARNGIENCRFEVANLLGGLPELTARPDIVVTDPPRAGMHKLVLAGLAELSPDRIVSVGCNPKTQAENLAWLCERAGYRITRMQAVDQFPQTPHVENVALLEK